MVFDVGDGVVYVQALGRVHSPARMLIIRSWSAAYKKTRFTGEKKGCGEGGSGCVMCMPDEERKVWPSFFSAVAVAAFTPTAVAGSVLS